MRCSSKHLQQFFVNTDETNIDFNIEVGRQPFTIFVIDPDENIVSHDVKLFYSFVSLKKK